MSKRKADELGSASTQVAPKHLALPYADDFPLQSDFLGEWDAGPDSENSVNSPREAVERKVTEVCLETA